MPHLLLAGYFCCGNLGDDAILVGLSEGLAGRGFEFTVMSGMPEETFRLYGMRSIARLDQRAIGAAIDECDMVVFPGGSIFQDVTSTRSVIYYHSIIRRAKRAGKKVVLVGQGVGPLKSFFGKRYATASFEMADGIVVRDPGSAQLLKDLGVRRPIKMGADTAFLVPPPQELGDGGDYQVGDMTTVGIAPRPFGRNVKKIQRLFGELSRLLFKNNMMPVMIEMDRTEDGPLIYEIGKLLGGKVPELRRLSTPMNIQQRMARMEAVIGMRLHAGILAASVGVPPYMISYDPKVTALAKLLNLAPAPPIDGLTSQRLFENFMEFQRDRPRNLKMLDTKRRELVKLAEVNVEAVLACLKSAARA